MRKQAKVWLDRAFWCYDRVGRHDKVWSVKVVEHADGTVTLERRWGKRLSGQSGKAENVRSVAAGLHEAEALIRSKARPRARGQYFEVAHEAVGL